MPSGLKTPSIAVTDRLSRMLNDGAVYTINTTSGSISVPEFLLGEPWYFVYTQSLELVTVPTSIVASGTTLSWTVDASLLPMDVVFGIY